MIIKSVDTDSTKGYDITSAELTICPNKFYGDLVMTHKDYIVVHYNDKPIIIFKKHITAIGKCDDGTANIFTVNTSFYADEKYGDVVKQML